MRQVLIGEQLEKANKVNLEDFLKIRDADRQRMMNLRQQQIQASKAHTSQEMQEEIATEGRSR